MKDPGRPYDSVDEGIRQRLDKLEAELKNMRQQTLTTHRYESLVNDVVEAVEGQIVIEGTTLKWRADDAWHQAGGGLPWMIGHSRLANTGSAEDTDPDQTISNMASAHVEYYHFATNAPEVFERFSYLGTSHAWYRSDFHFKEPGLYLAWCYTGFPIVPGGNASGEYPYRYSKVSNISGANSVIWPYPDLYAADSSTNTDRAGEDFDYEEGSNSQAVVDLAILNSTGADYFASGAGGYHVYAAHGSQTVGYTTALPLQRCMTWCVKISDQFFGAPSASHPDTIDWDTVVP